MHIGLRKSKLTWLIQPYISWTNKFLVVSDLFYYYFRFCSFIGKINKITYDIVKFMEHKLNETQIIV